MGKLVFDINKYIHLHLDLKDAEKVSFLHSKNFETIFRSFLRSLREDNDTLLSNFKGIFIDDYLECYRLLARYELKTVLRRLPKFKEEHVNPLFLLTKKLFAFWQHFERYAFISEPTTDDKLLDIHTKFNNEVNIIYQNIMRKLSEGTMNTFLTLPAGVNATLCTNPYTFLKNKDYNVINNIPFVNKVILNTPYFLNTKSLMKRNSLKPLTFSYNPLKDMKINKKDFYGVALKVGSLLAFVYIHQAYLSHLIALTNLFELIDAQKVKDDKPDLLFIFGVNEDMYDGKYYHDPLDDTYIGFMCANEENDYFGYFKDMLLTLHNLYMLDHNALPVAGTLVEINLKPNITKKVLFVGDVYSGKYEVLETLNLITNDEISDIKVISDSFNVLKLENDDVFLSGTEIGGFLEKEALKAGYSYKGIEKAVIINPLTMNTKYVMPLSEYSYINQKHNLDLILYVNNYEDKSGIKIFLKPEDAINAFKKGTTKTINQNGDEILINTHFANPLSISQYKVKTDNLITKYFKRMDETGIYMGEMYTKRFVKNESSRGINNAALALLKFLES